MAAELVSPIADVAVAVVEVEVDVVGHLARMGLCLCR